MEFPKEQTFGDLRYPSTLAFDYPSIRRDFCWGGKNSGKKWVRFQKDLLMLIRIRKLENIIIKKLHDHTKISKISSYKLDF